MTESKKWVDTLLGKMTTEQKIGQLLVFGFCGPVVTPDVVDMIRKYHVGGLRISQKFRVATLLNDQKPGTEPDEITLQSLHYPHGNNRDYAYTKHCTNATPQEYAQTLNILRDVSLERKLGIPIHFTIDQEGSACDDLLSGQRLFPHPMGYAASNSPEIAYKAALSIGKQARALGVNMIHSPTLDVNTNPRNPEIGTRAYSDKPEEVVRYALQSLKGFSESGLICTGKHFPGRGESESDAHWGLPVVTVDREELYNTHIMPYRPLIDAGLPAIMMAHCCYQCIGVTEDPAGMSRELIQNILRAELDFKGVITTDNMMMGGILKKYEMSEAIVKMVIAGCDLILCRDESPIRIKIIESLTEAVRAGRLTEQRLDEAVERILIMRWNMGLAENGGKVDDQKAADPINDPFVVEAAKEAADKSVLLIRDEAKLLPLDPDKKILLVEQIFPTHEFSNNMYSHPGLLWDEMCKLSDNVASVEIPYVPGEMDKERIYRRLHEADVIVTTNYYYHKNACAISDVVRRIIAKSKKPVVVVTNTPFELGAPKDFPVVITSFNPGGRENLNAVARVLYGKLVPTAQVPVKL